MSIEWRIFTDEDSTPHMVIYENGKERIATHDECKRACLMLNEDGSNVVKIHCVNKECVGFGGWIERTRANLEKTVYKCDVCGKPMQR